MGGWDNMSINCAGRKHKPKAVILWEAGEVTVRSRAEYRTELVLTSVTSYCEGAFGARDCGSGP